MEPLKIVIFLAVTLSIGTIGCTAVEPYRYNVYWENRSGKQLKDIRISYGDFTTSYGGHLWVTEPITPTVAVEFRAPDGRMYQRRVHVPEEIRRNIRLGDLIFYIESDLSVSVFLRSQEERKAEAGTL